MSDEEHIFMARVAEQAERFDDMVDFLKPVLQNKGSALSSDERNLLSVAFKSLISSKRAAWRTITAIEQNPKYQKYGSHLADYKKKIEAALYKDCEDIIEIVRSKVARRLPNSSTTSSPSPVVIHTVPSGAISIA